MWLTYKCVISERMLAARQTREEKSNGGVGVYCCSIYFTMQFCIKSWKSEGGFGRGNHHHCSVVIHLSSHSCLLLTIDMSVWLNHNYIYWPLSWVRPRPKVGRHPEDTACTRAPLLPPAVWFQSLCEPCELPPRCSFDNYELLQAGVLLVTL